MPTKPASKAKPRTSSPPAAKTSPGMKAAIATSQAIADDAPKTVDVQLLADKGPVKPEDWTRARDIIAANEDWFLALKRELKKVPSTAQLLKHWDEQQADDGNLDSLQAPPADAGGSPHFDPDFDAEDYDAAERAAQKSLQQELARPPILPKETAINVPRLGGTNSRRKNNGRKRTSHVSGGR